MARNALLGMAQMPTLQYRPETQVESLGKATQAVGGLQAIQMRQMDLEKAKQDSAMLQQFSQRMAQAGKNPDPSIYGQALIQTGRPELVAKGTEIMRAVQSEAALKQELGGYQNRLAQGDARGVAQSMAVSPTPGMAQRAQALTRTLPPEPKGYAPTELERLNAALAKLPPGSPERKVYEARIAKLTEPSKGVTMILPKQQDEFEKKLGSGQAEKVLKDRDAAEEAASIIGTVQRGQELLSQPIITGFGAEFLTNFGSALNQIGFSVAKDAVANTQAFAANMAQNVGKIIKQFGAGTGLSNADREYAEKMAGGKITLDKAALAKILDINERAARNVIQAHNKRVAGIKTNLPLTIEMPAARGRVGDEATSVTLPDGRVMNFPDAAAAAGYKKAAGL